MRAVRPCVSLAASAFLCHDPNPQEWDVYFTLTLARLLQHERTDVVSCEHSQIRVAGAQGSSSVVRASVACLLVAAPYLQIFLPQLQRAPPPRLLRTAPSNVRPHSIPPPVPSAHIASRLYQAIEVPAVVLPHTALLTLLQLPLGVSTIRQKEPHGPEEKKKKKCKEKKSKGTKLHRGRNTATCQTWRSTSRVPQPAIEGETGDSSLLVLLVSDRDAHCIAAVPVGVPVEQKVQTLFAGAGPAIVALGVPNGPGYAAGRGLGAAGGSRFNQPTGLAVSKDGMLFVFDSGNNEIRAVDLSLGRQNAVITVAGSVKRLHLPWRDGAFEDCSFGGEGPLALSPAAFQQGNPNNACAIGEGPSLSCPPLLAIADDGRLRILDFRCRIVVTIFLASDAAESHEHCGAFEALRWLPAVENGAHVLVATGTQVGTVVCRNEGASWSVLRRVAACGAMPSLHPCFPMALLDAQTGIAFPHAISKRPGTASQLAQFVVLPLLALGAESATAARRLQLVRGRSTPQGLCGDNGVKKPIQLQRRNSFSVASQPGFSSQPLVSHPVTRNTAEVTKPRPHIARPASAARSSAVLATRCYDSDQPEKCVIADSAQHCATLIREGEDESILPFLAADDNDESAVVLSVARSDTPTIQRTPAIRVDVFLFHRCKYCSML